MAQLELLWAAAALMLLGAAISLCVKCQLSASKREKQPSERRSPLESQQRFEVIRSHSTATRRLDQIKETANLSIARKTTEELGASRRAGYEDCLRGDAAYVEPISLDYHNCVRFFTPPNDDAVDYENSPAIHTWKLYQAEALQMESPDDEPDYVNTAPAPLSKQSILHKV
ncbi:linker for activation of T-cells family member 2 isoform X4 [Chroicocephalus ridibundus]|uniref:linker for activation of T-cells family member 2 isoform X4 n=1 Tax=Chroicocephalus ridibundus TaxID=1192867 RepID=UPI002FDDBE5D